MATSSIFAKIELKDPVKIRDFVDALCSDKPWPQPKRKAHSVKMTDDDFGAFLDKGPYATRAVGSMR